MLSDEQLDDALRSALCDLTSDVEPSTRLQEQVNQISRPARNRAGLLLARPRALASVAVSTVAVAIAAVISLGPGAVSPSYAVTLNPGHSVRITLYELTGIRPANARLHALGVRARIVPMTATCKNRIELSYLGIAEKPAPTINLTLPIRRGTTIVLAARHLKGIKVEMALGRTTGKPPTCASTKGIGPGVSAFTKTGSPKP
jgi:hypothetical protein